MDAPGTVNARGRRRLVLILLAGLVLFFWRLGSHDLWPPDEPPFLRGCDVAVCALMALARNDEALLKSVSRSWLTETTPTVLRQPQER